MATNAKQVEVKFGKNTFQISAEAAKRLMQELIEESKPAKPIKREVRISNAFCRAVHKKIAAVDKDMKLVSKEHERLMDLYERKLSPEDEAWLDDATRDLYVLLDECQELGQHYFT